MTEFTYEHIIRIKNSIKAEIGCDEPLQAASKGYGEPTKHPRPDLPSTIVCLMKARHGLDNNKCSAIDGSMCPKGYSIEALQKLAT